ncbi:glyoxalase superfamily protein [Sphingosinicella terrae]|uniref:glyoxalase superfamily protein n=1 Tax=Sphingosinicella terrae TaxID=2172047 RepID=UPI000E0D8898|nr:glyoxalase superfamily protein [Sphingosinicella terrae]
MTAAPAPRLVRAAPELPVDDLDRALAYYDGQLGFRTMSRMPQGNYAVVQRDDVALHLFSDGDASTPVSLHIFVEEIERLESDLGSRGARITQPLERRPWGNRDFRIVDPFGNQIKFTEPAAV